MKIKVKIKELNESSPELMVELLQYLDDLIDLGRATRTIVNTANKLSDLGVALGKNIRPEAARFVGKLEDLNPQTAINFRDAVEGARRAAEESGEAVSFMFELPNGGRITAIVNPDGLSVIRKGYRPSIAKEGERVANKRFDYDSAARAGDDAADEVVDAGEEAARVADDLPGVPRLGSIDTPYETFEEARKAIQDLGPWGIRFKDFFNRARRLSIKFPDLEVPVRPPTAANPNDAGVFFKRGNTTGILVYRNGKLTEKIYEDSISLSISDIQALMNKLDEAQKLLGFKGTNSVVQFFRGIGRQAELLKSVYFPKDSGVIKNMASLIADLSVATPFRILSSGAGYLAREGGFITAEGAISVARYLKYGRALFGFGYIAGIAADEGTELYEKWFGDLNDRRFAELEALKNRYALRKSDRDRRRIIALEKDIIETARELAYKVDRDENTIRTVDDAKSVRDQYLNEWEGFLGVLVGYKRMMNKIALGPAALKYLLEKNTLSGPPDDIDVSETPGDLEDFEEKMKVRMTPGSEKEKWSKPNEYEYSVDSKGVEVDASDADTDVPTPKPDQPIPDTKLGIKGFSKALDEALSSNNIIFKNTRPSARMKVKITELKNED